MLWVRKNIDNIWQEEVDKRFFFFFFFFFQAEDSIRDQPRSRGLGNVYKNAAIAGHFGVPVIMVSGDDAAVKEVKSIIGNIEGAIVKESISFHSAKSLHPEAAYDLIAEKTAYAVKNIKKYKPYKIRGPITVSITFKHYQPSQILAYLDMFKRTGSHTIEYKAKDMIEASHIIRVVTGFNGGKTSP